MNNSLVLVSGAIIFKDQRNGRKWLLVKHSEGDEWEIPKVVVRKVESSVRAIIRMMGEQGGMSIQVFEEAGRAGGVTTVNGKTLPQRYLYYLATYKSAEGEMVGFEKTRWFEYAKAVRKLSTKRERAMIKSARKELRTLIREQKKQEQPTS
jgi:hypothetical protein